MKRKLLSVVLCMTMLGAVLTGCNKATDNTDDTTKSDVKAEAVDIKKVFVTPQWVQSVIDGNQPESEDYVIAEVSWGDVKDSPTYKDGHIQGAVHLDSSVLETEPYWNISEPEVIEKVLLEAGINKDKTVILYGSDVSETARVAFECLWAGVENVKILDGGLTAWEKEGYTLSKEDVTPTKETDFGVQVPAHPEYWTSLEETKTKLENDDNFKLVSIRSEAEFKGETSGYNYIDRAGEPKGAIWGYAGSDPYNMESYTHEDGTYITVDEMNELWKDLDFNKDNDVAFYCGTGWRACIPFLLAYEAGWENVSVYDGGWFEWQMHDELPVQLVDPNSGELVYTTVGELSTDKAFK